MGKPKLIVLIGPPGSGKSTWRSKNAGNAVIISSDDAIDEYAERNGLTYSEAFHKVDMKDIARRINQQFDHAVAAGDDIIIDRTNMTSNGRKKFLNRVGNRYEKIAVVFEVPRDELNRRLLARKEATGKGIPDRVVDDMLASYETPSSEFDKIVRA